MSFNRAGDINKTMRMLLGLINLKLRQNIIGFTLIELSIVLIIIGLVAGGILMGKDLIQKSEMRKFISDMEKYESALTSFELKYDCIAGDCVNASNLFSGAINGDGNGIIKCNTPSSDERLYLWNHLSSANLISGRYSTASGSCYSIIIGTRIPATAMNPNIGYHYTGLNGWGLTSGTVWGFQVGAIGTTNNWKDYLWGAGLTSTQAYEVDIKIDNGNPRTGKVQATNANEPSVINTNTTCLSGNNYILNSNSTGCNFYYNFQKYF